MRRVRVFLMLAGVLLLSALLFPLVLNADQLVEKEPNNTRETATLLPVNTTITGFLDQEVMYSDDSRVDNICDDIDFFKVTIPSDGYIELDFRIIAHGRFHQYYIDSGDGWVVRLYDDRKNEIYMQLVFNELHTQKIGLGAGVYYICVDEGISFADTVFFSDDDLYALNVSFTDAGRWEKEPNDVKSRATVIEANQTYHGSYLELLDDPCSSVIPEDIDFYKVTVSKECYAKAVYQSKGRCGKQISVIGPSGGAIYTGKLKKNFSSPVLKLAKGSYYVRIIGSGNPESNVAYSIQLQTGFPYASGLSYAARSKGGTWGSYVKNGKTAGRAANSNQLTSLRIKMNDIVKGSGGIQYKVHTKGGSWEASYRQNNSISGVPSKPIDAVRIKLYGKIANEFDVYYRTYLPKKGWLGWAKNDENSGTFGYNLAISAIQVRLVSKALNSPGSRTNRFYAPSPTVNYAVRISNTGWSSFGKNGAAVGTSSDSKYVTAVKMTVRDEVFGGSIKYRTLMKGGEWSAWKTGGTPSGSTGTRKLTAVGIQLTGGLAKQFDIYYCVKCESSGWLGWAKNGEGAGTNGYGYAVRAVKVKLVPKGMAAPGSTAGHYVTK